MSDNMFRRKSIACGFLNGFLARNVMILWQNGNWWSCCVCSFFLQSLFPGVWLFSSAEQTGLPFEFVAKTSVRPCWSILVMYIHLIMLS